MKEFNTSLSSPIDSKVEKLTEAETKLLEWIEIIIAVVCFIALIYTFFFSPSPGQIKWKYIGLIATEIVLLLVAIIFYRQNKLTHSTNLLILAGIIGPWCSAIFDPTVINGNLFPLVYIAIPILFTSFFSSVSVSIVIGMIQILGLAIFIYLGNFDLSMGAASLFFFVVFIFAISLILNVQNRNNRRTISAQVEKLKELAIRDPLTGLYNRRFPIEFLQKEFAKIKRSGGTLAVIILDIDNFKYYNDTYGHNCGDDILVSISRLLQKNFRESDVICRFGGDEFFIAMNDADLDEAKNRAESLRKLIAEEEFYEICKEEVIVTISIGIAVYPKHGDTVDEVLIAADQTLYEAKDLGKNRVVVKE